MRADQARSVADAAIARQAAELEEQEDLRRQKELSDRDRNRAYWRTEGLESIYADIEKAAEAGRRKLEIDSFRHPADKESGDEIVVPALKAEGYEAEMKWETALESYADAQGQAFRKAQCYILHISW